MIVYKITNKINNKVYIGQTINSLEQRFARHKNDALNNILDTHFARAIRKYGIDNFVAQVIDSAESQQELTKKQQYWIHYYNSTVNGYNETDAQWKSGGNTYAGKTEEQLNQIKEKIRASKIGGNNPQSKKVKCKNVNTDQEHVFDSMSEMQTFFQETNHQFCSRRCRHEIKCLYKNEWVIAYETDDYITDYTMKGKTPKRGSQIKIKNQVTGEEYTFNSIRQADRELHGQIPNRQLIGKIIKGEFPQQSPWIISKI